jgi:hypothetical protein
MRIAANATAALTAVASAYAATWYATGALSPDGTWFDLLGALAFMALALGAGALAIPRRHRG